VEGVVTDTLDAIVTFRALRADGATIQISAVIDTGFTEFLTLPLALMQELEFPLIGGNDMVLADGGIKRILLHVGTIQWHDEERLIPVHRCDSDPLIGMSLLVGSKLNIEVIPSGRVEITPLPE
jgi:clan AA aspartic protease